MTTSTQEKEFQKDFFTYLENTGYTKRTTKDYNVISCLDEDLLFEFIESTQLEAWQHYEKMCHGNAKKEFIDSLLIAIENDSTIEVIRKGFRDKGLKFNLFYSKPNNSTNPQLIENFKKNIFSVIDELEYENKSHSNRIDLVIFINGIPIITIELKDTFSQGVENAEKQYKEDRNPNEKLFKMCLCHFAMSDSKISMTTKLKGEKTSFLPFNKGIENPDAGYGLYKTSYLYTEILQKNQLANLIENFIFEENGKYIFPRYHQLDCVNYLIENSSPGNNYLVQHSAGSGKTKTIAWLAHNLLNKFDTANKRIYDMVFVISDRLVIDEQLQEQVLIFEKEDGTVAVIDDKKRSKDLAKEILNKTNIVVSTLQKFSFIVDEIKDIEDRNYAVIVDEAHSSQSGTHSQNLKLGLSHQVEQDPFFDQSDDEIDKKLRENVDRLRNKTNLSFFAFTATPKQKTLEMFGKKNEFGEYEPHHLYTMEQAIKEGFILDVLKYYMPYKTYFNLVKTIAEDNEYDKARVIALARKFVNEHPSTISQKTEIILDHFNNSTINRIPDSNNVGQARAMLVTESRKQAGKYKLELDRQIALKDLPFKTLVAFTGEIVIDGIAYTEDSMNDTNEKIDEAFKEDPYRILIVADKYQTGFDEPLLHTMYVDKRLNGVKTVQTLSRLNRTYPNKTDTLILDFANDIEDIQRDFQRYYGETILTEGTDYRKLYELRGNLYSFKLFTEEEVYQFVKDYHSNAPQSEIHKPLDNALSNYLKLETVELQAEFKRTLKKYQNMYSFLCQLLDFTDLDLEKLYQFCYFLNRKLPTINDPLPFNIANSVDLSSYTIDTGEEPVTIELVRGTGELSSPSGKTGPIAFGEKIKLSEIIKIINERFGTEFDSELENMLLAVEDNIKHDDKFIEILRNENNDETILRKRFPFDKAMAEIYLSDPETYGELYNSIFKDSQLKSYLENEVFNRIYLEREAIV